MGCKEMDKEVMDGAAARLRQELLKMDGVVSVDIERSAGTCQSARFHVYMYPNHLAGQWVDVALKRRAGGSWQLNLFCGRYHEDVFPMRKDGGFSWSKIATEIKQAAHRKLLRHIETTQQQAAEEANTPAAQALEARYDLGDGNDIQPSQDISKPIQLDLRYFRHNLTQEQAEKLLETMVEIGLISRKESNG